MSSWSSFKNQIECFPYKSILPSCNNHISLVLCVLHSYCIIGQHIYVINYEILDNRDHILLIFPDSNKFSNMIIVIYSKKGFIRGQLFLSVCMERLD